MLLAHHTVVKSMGKMIKKGLYLENINCFPLVDLQKKDIVSPAFRRHYQTHMFVCMFSGVCVICACLPFAVSEGTGVE